MNLQLNGDLSAFEGLHPEFATSPSATPTLTNASVTISPTMKSERKIVMGARRDRGIKKDAEGSGTAASSKLITVSSSPSPSSNLPSIETNSTTRRVTAQSNAPVGNDGDSSPGISGGSELLGSTYPQPTSQSYLGVPEGGHIGIYVFTS